MFTGIIETLGKVKAIEPNGVCLDFVIESSISHELKIDQSVSHNGACLTVVEIKNDLHRVTAVPETLQKTNLGNLKTGDLVNLERCTQVGARLDGHIVLGHVDQTGKCTNIQQNENSWLFTFSYHASLSSLVVEKGSICLNGISLTVFNVTNTEFTIAVIPYTYEHTNIQQIKVGDSVNLEFDIIGKYAARIQSIIK